MATYLGSATKYNQNGDFQALEFDTRDCSSQFNFQAAKFHFIDNGNVVIVGMIDAITALSPTSKVEFPLYGIITLHSSEEYEIYDSATKGKLKIKPQPCELALIKLIAHHGIAADILYTGNLLFDSATMAEILINGDYPLEKYKNFGFAELAGDSGTRAVFEGKKYDIAAAGKGKTAGSYGAKAESEADKLKARLAFITAQMEANPTIKFDPTEVTLMALGFMPYLPVSHTF